MRLQDLYLEAARQRPDAVAVEAADAVLTYRALDAAANRVARALLAKGVGPGDQVGLWLDKSAAAVVAMQGVLRTGAAYVPVDPQSPVARAQGIIASASLSVVVADAARAAQLPTGVCSLLADDGFAALSHLDDAPVPTAPGVPDDLAYVLYTSGSTGAPKGVRLSHTNALAFVRWAAGAVGATPEDRFSNHAPFHFDLSVFDLYVAALVGASVYIIPEAQAYLPKRLVATMVEARISVWYSVPSALVLMMQHGDLLTRLEAHRPRVVVFAGEPFPVEPLRTLRAALPRARLWNFFGPTETNVCCAHEVHHLAPDAKSVPIGGPASEDTCFVRRADGGLAGAGEEGELIVEGPTVMLGYAGQPALDERRWPTGDLVRVRADGGYDYLGRKDRMVKVRGYRIELEEVEAALSRHPEVRQVAVAVHGSGTAAKLVAFIVAEAESLPGVLELKRFSASILPRYMLVDRVVALPELPRTRNGKLDRRQLQRGNNRAT